MLVRRGQDVGGLGHEVHAAEDDVVGLGPVGGVARQLERVTGHVRELDDLVPLVVVAEDQEPLAELGLRRGDPAVELVGRREGVAVRQWSLHSQHVSPRGVWAPVWPAGTAWSPTAGLSAPELFCAGYQASTVNFSAEPPFRAATSD